MHDRHIPLDRVLNFRDFGGYDAASGARVAAGRLYRSAHFADASDSDIAKLDALDVAFMVDLRRPEERAFEPNRWPGEGVRSFSHDEGQAGGLPPHLMALFQEELTAASVAHYMREIYRGFAFEPRHIALYRTWFAELARAEGAAILHCAAGKDRTGLGCALTLHALGVGEETIFADYELTNTLLELGERLPRIQARLEERLGRKLDPEALKPMLGVAPDYLRGALDAITAQHGSLEAYLENTLGVGEPQREHLRRTLLA
jgi:protein-tyrosine phosphatase